MRDSGVSLSVKATAQHSSELCSDTSSNNNFTLVLVSAVAIVVCVVGCVVRRRSASKRFDSTYKTSISKLQQKPNHAGTVAYIGIRDALTTGNLLYHTPLDASKTIATGDVFRVAIGSLSVTLA